MIVGAAVGVVGVESHVALRTARPMTTANTLTLALGPHPQRVLTLMHLAGCFAPRDAWPQALPQFAAPPAPPARPAPPALFHIDANLAAEHSPITGRPI